MSHDFSKRLRLNIDEDDSSLFSNSKWLGLPSDATTKRLCMSNDTLTPTLASTSHINIRVCPSQRSVCIAGGDKNMSGFGSNFSSPDNQALMPAPYKLPAESTVRIKHKRRTKQVEALKDAGRWKPYDDLLLIVSVLQLNDLHVIHKFTKFSCKFTYLEILKRWQALLYDELISRTARAAINKMHAEQKASVYRRAPFSEMEEKLLCNVLSINQPTLDDFQALLEANSQTFYHSRTPKSLQNYWRLLKQHRLLNDQCAISNECAAGVLPPSFSDAEQEINDACLDELDPQIECEMNYANRQATRKIRLLENEMGHWAQLMSAVGANVDNFPRFDSKTMAALYGKCLRYEMRKRFVYFGRSTESGEVVDVDLTVEGPVGKISRRQGAIELHNDGTFVTANFGKHVFFVNGKPVLPGHVMTVKNNSVFEICSVSFTFLINKDVVEDICFKQLPQIDELIPVAT